MIQVKRHIVIPDFMQIRVMAPQAVAAAIPWWLSGGISAANCYCAYQPKGAASLAASYSNLNDPGTNNAGVGVAPTWDAVNGWIFNGSTQYLTTTFVPANDQSQMMVVQFSNVTGDGYICGVYNATGIAFSIGPSRTGQRWYRNGETSNPGANVLSGNMCVAGAQGYLNGAADGGWMGPWRAPTLGTVWIGCMNQSGVVFLPLAAYIQALAIYDTTLTAPQVAAVSAAMALL